MHQLLSRELCLDLQKPSIFSSTQLIWKEEIKEEEENEKP